MKCYFIVVFRLISQLLQLSSQLNAFLNLWQFLTGGTGANTIVTPLLLLSLFGGASKTVIKVLGIALLALFTDISQRDSCPSILYTL